MIRAIVKDGLIQPLSPLPVTFPEGREVVVSIVDDDHDLTPEEIDEWYQRTNELAALCDPAEDAAMMVELDRLRAEQKEIMRRRVREESRI